MKKRGLDLPGERTAIMPASLWKRAVAFIIDLLVIELVIAFPFRNILDKIMPIISIKDAYSYLQSHPDISIKMNIVAIIIGLLALLYFAVIEYKTQQTIGKMFMNIYVKSTAKKLAFWQCLARNMLFIMVFPFILLWIIDPLFAVFTREHRRLSEILSKTMVVGEYPI